MIKWMELTFYEEKLIKLCFFNLEKRRHWSDLISNTNRTPYAQITLVVLYFKYQPLSFFSKG